MQGKVGRYLIKTFFFIYFKCCYKFYSNIIRLQLIVFTIIFVYNKWKKINLSLNLLRSLTSTSTASSIIQLVLTCKRQKKMKSAQLTEKNFQADKKKSSLKLAGRNQNAIGFIMFLLFLFANHKKISILGSQREK